MSNAVIRKNTYSNIAHRLCHFQMSNEKREKLKSVLSFMLSVIFHGTPYIAYHVT